MTFEEGRKVVIWQKGVHEEGSVSKCAALSFDISHAGGKHISALLNIIYSEVIACPHVHVQWIKRHCHNVRRDQTEESVVAKNDQKMCGLINLGRETHVK